MREMTPGLAALRDSLARLLAQGFGHEDWENTPGFVQARFIDEASELVEEPDTLGFLAAVDTLVREGFERGASPALGALLAEVGHVIPDTRFGAGFQEGLARAIQVLSSEDAAKQQEAYRRGFQDGHAARHRGAGRPNWTAPDGG